jgi:hypothetical protein
VCLLFAAACGVDGTDDRSSNAEQNELEQAATAPTHGHPDPATPASPAAPTSGASFADAFSWSTEEFEVAPGKDRYLCYSKKLEEDLVIDGYETPGASFVHHLIFSRSRGGDKLGFEDCPEAFRMGWDPVFITGAGPATLEFPTGAGHKLPKGTQLTVQMHLLNTGDEPVKGKLNIKMRRTAVTNPRPVNSYIFGTAAVKLPPKQVSKVVGTCRVREAIKLIAAFPHMHMLGTKMTFEVGQSEATMKEVFKRDPFTFDNQSIERLMFDLKPGDITRVTCTYNNTLSQEVKYGESTLNEMCYLIGFAVDRAFQSACLEVIPPLF